MMQLAHHPSPSGSHTQHNKSHDIIRERLSSPPSEIDNICSVASLYDELWYEDLLFLPGSTGGGIFHDHHFRHVAEFAEIFSQAFGARLPTETSDKHFPVGIK